MRSKLVFSVGSWVIPEKISQLASLAFALYLELYAVKPPADLFLTKYHSNATHIQVEDALIGVLVDTLPHRRQLGRETLALTAGYYTLDSLAIMRLN